MERKAGKMKKIQELITKDLGWKLLSVGIATILWFMVINIEHPIDTRVYTQTIQFENEDLLAEKGLTVPNLSELQNTKVIIKVKAQRTALDRFTQYKHNIRATVDLKKATKARSGDTVGLMVNVSLPDTAESGFEIISKSPSTIQVTLEELVSKEKYVVVENVGNTADGFVLADVNVNPQKVLVTGAESIVNQVDTVKVFVNAQDLKQDAVFRAKPIAYDANNNEVQDVTINEDEVKVGLGIYRSKKIPVKVETTGLPKTGFTIGKITCSPSTIEVIGREDALNAIQNVSLSEMNIKDANQDITEIYQVDSFLPDGISLKPQTTGTVQVWIEIKPDIKKQFEIPIDRINMTGSKRENLEYTFGEEAILVELRGSSEKIESLAENSITGTVDISNITEEGTYTLPVELKVPEGLTLVGEKAQISMKVDNITKEEETTQTEVQDESQVEQE